MKNSSQRFANFTILLCMLLLLVAIILHLFVEDELWHVLIAIVSFSCALFSISDLFKKSADDQKSMFVISGSILDPLFERCRKLSLFTDGEGNDLRKLRYSDEAEFARSLRNVTDERERAMRELLWEHKNNGKRPSRSRSNFFVRIVFLVLAFVFLIGSLVVLFFFPRYFPSFPDTWLDAIVLGSLVLVLACAFSAGGNFGYLQKLELLLGLKERCEAILEENGDAREKAALPPSPSSIYASYGAGPFGSAAPGAGVSSAAAGSVSSSAVSASAAPDPIPSSSSSSAASVSSSSVPASQSSSKEAASSGSQKEHRLFGRKKKSSSVQEAAPAADTPESEPAEAIGSDSLSDYSSSAFTGYSDSSSLSPEAALWETSDSESESEDTSLSVSEADSAED